jgi:CO/xanthine dehydrogenase Mo-binding subunit
MQIQIGQLWGASALSKIAVGSVDWESATTINSLASARATAGVAKVVTVFDLYDFVIKNNAYNSANQPGFTAQSITGANFTAAGSSQETFGNQFINYYGQRIAIVLSEDLEVAQRVADGMTFGYKNEFTGYATSVIDAVNKGYVMNNGTTSNGYNNANILKITIIAYLSKTLKISQGRFFS